MTANLPEVGAAQAAGSARPSFRCHLGGSSCFNYFQCPDVSASHPSAVGYISRAAANCFDRQGSVVPGTPRGAWGQPRASCPPPITRLASGQAERRPQLQPAGRLCQVHITQGQTETGDTPVTLACLPPSGLCLPGADGMRGWRCQRSQRARMPIGMQCRLAISI